MNWIYKTIAIAILLCACQNVSNTEEFNGTPSDLVLSNNFHKKYIRPSINRKTQYIVLYSEAACHSCFLGYFDRLLPKFKGNSFVFYSSQMNNDAIQHRYDLEKSIFKTAPRESNFDRQYFMRHELVVLKVDPIKNEVEQFIPIKASNIETLNFE